MSELTDGIHISNRVVWSDHQTGEHGAYVKHVTVTGERTEIAFDDAEGLLPASTLMSTNREIARWELAKYLARQNRDAQLRSIPEAERRAASRRQRHAEQRCYIDRRTCGACHNTGWVDDLGDGTSGVCPLCLGVTTPQGGIAAD